MEVNKNAPFYSIMSLSWDRIFCSFSDFGHTLIRTERGLSLCVFVCQAESYNSAPKEKKQVKGHRWT